MAGAKVVELQSSVLESDLEAILPEPKVEEGEEFVDLAAEKPESVTQDAVPAKKPAAAPAAKKAAPAADADDDLPEDLKGKSPKELAKMYREAQSLIGRQGSELGEFRRKADLLIQASLANLAKGRGEEKPAAKKEDAAAEDDETEFFAKPRDAVSKAIENHPIIKQIRETLGQAAADRETQRATTSTEKFNTAHPDAGQIMQDPEFRKWVGASRVRSALLRRAHEKFDFDAGDEVFGTWKALKGVKAAPAGGEDTSAAAKTLAAAAKAKREAALRDASTPTGGGAGASKAGGSKKIYRRADVLRLMEQDAERYEALAPEIELAYREGRVR